MDTASLRITVDSSQVTTATGQLGRLERQGRQTERATDGLGAAFGRAFVALGVATGAMLALNKALSVQRQFDVLNAGLVTATGSAEDAALAFEALTEFASTTPYSLDQAVSGFTRLVNMGLTPSEEALRSYGNTAAAMGKDLNMMIEAVADAATGEFERLKEFGIRASSEGDRVRFTFRGVTTEVGKNAAEIEQYLIGLGENEFGGAMANRMATLDGALSNLGDSFDSLVRNINEAGVGQIMADAVHLAIGALDELNAMFESGQIQGYLEALAAQFGGIGRDITESWGIVTEALGDDTSYVVGFIGEVLEDIPANFRAMVQLVTTEIAVLVDGMQTSMGAVRDILIAASPYGHLRQVFSDGESVRDIYKRVNRELQAFLDTRRASIETIMEERDATIAATDAAKQQAAERRAAFEASRAERAARLEGLLGRFGKGGQDGTSPSGSGSGSGAASGKALDALVKELQTEEEAIAASYARRLAIINGSAQVSPELREELKRRAAEDRDEEMAQLEEQKGRELSQLQESLMTQEEAMRASYERRRQIVLDNTAEDSELRTQLLEKLGEEYALDVANYEESLTRKRDALYNSLLTEDEVLVQAYERKRGEILRAEEITELERQDLLRRLKAQFDAEQAQMEQQRIQQQLGSAGQLFGGLAGLAKAYGGEQSKAYRALFAVSKAFSIAQGLISIQTGLALAQKLGFPANLAEMARVAATGASIIASIRGTTFSGAYDQGGQIPAGKFGLVGEYGPEFVRGPAMVTGRELTARQTRMSGGGGEGINITTSVVVNADGTTTSNSDARQSDAKALNDAITARVREVMVNESRQGGLLWRMRNG